MLDIVRVKPGGVVTNMARPLDLPPAKATTWPDVLVIESGEIWSPGALVMKNIGLPPGISYACLAETLVLALAGRVQSCTVDCGSGWEQAHEIYKLPLKHSLQLAAISGVTGVFSDQDIERVRELALAATGKQGPQASPAKPARLLAQGGFKTRVKARPATAQARGRGDRLKIWRRST